MRTKRKYLADIIPTEEFCELWRADVPTSDIAVRYGVTAPAINTYAKAIGLSPRNLPPRRRTTFEELTPRQIRRRCSKVRKNWSDAERERRWTRGGRKEFSFSCHADGERFGEPVSQIAHPMHGVELDRFNQMLDAAGVPPAADYSFSRWHETRD